MFVIATSGSLLHLITEAFAHPIEVKVGTIDCQFLFAVQVLGMLLQSSSECKIHGSMACCYNRQC